MAKVTVQVAGGSPQVREVGTVGDLKSQMSLSNHAATVNGEPADNSRRLTDYEFVTLAPAVKGA